MKSDYALPGIAAIAIAILFPALMMYEIISFDSSSSKGTYFSLGEWGFPDFIFILIGLLSVFVFYQFKKILNEQLNFKTLDILLWIMIGLNILFHVVLVLADGYLGLSGINIEAMGFTLTALTVSALIVFGLVDVLIGSLLLLDHQKRPKILAILGMVSIFLGVFEMAFPLFGLVLILFPAYMIILGVYFLREPETIEVV